MKARLLVDFARWYPNKPHEAVFTTPMSAGISIYLHYPIYMQLKQAKGQLGAISVFNPSNRIRWQIVKPGDYIVRLYVTGQREYLHLTPEQFSQRFEVVR